HPARGAPLPESGAEEEGGFLISGTSWRSPHGKDESVPEERRRGRCDRGNLGPPAGASEDPHRRRRQSRRIRRPRYLQSIRRLAVRSKREDRRDQGGIRKDEVAHARYA